MLGGGVRLQCRKLSYRLEEGNKTILQDVSLDVKPGEMLALLGESGSGKTSLLNVLSGRIACGVVSGEILYNGIRREKKMKRITAYCMQDDLLHSHLTVLQTLMFAAQLRLPEKMPFVEKERLVEELLTNMRLQKCKNTIIGGHDARGVSGGERRRVSIGVELIADPSVVLLDEPTSGLDSATAKLIIENLRKVSTSKTVICSIHQPSSELFFSFDKVLVMSSGCAVYYGSPRGIVDYLAGIGFKSEMYWNPADFILSLCSQSTENSQRLISEWKTASSKEDVEPMVTEGRLDIQQKWKTSWLTQFLILLRRSFFLRKGSLITTVNLIENIALGFVIGIVWFQMPLNEDGVQLRLGILFFATAFWMFSPAFLAMLLFPPERAVVIRERASGTYRTSAYFFAKSLCEIPVGLLYPTIYVIITYWMTGMQANFGKFLLQLLVVYLLVMVAEGMGYAFSTAFRDISKALSASTVVFLLLMVVGGFYVQESLIPSWLEWVVYLSPIKYSYFLLSKIEFSGLEFQCFGPNQTSYPSLCSSAGQTFSGTQALEASDVTGSTAVSISVLFVFVLAYRTLAFFLFRRQTKTPGNYLVSSFLRSALRDFAFSAAAAHASAYFLISSTHFVPSPSFSSRHFLRASV